MTNSTMLTVGSPEPSRYIRTTWMISAQRTLKFSDLSQIRLLSASEAEQLSERVQRRNVFARHARENSFYVQRAKELADQTVIEVFRPGDPQHVSIEADRVASILEKVTLLSTIFTLKKSEFQKKLGVSSKPRTEMFFFVSPDFRFLSSRARQAPAARGILVDEAFCRRFFRCGFGTLTDFIQSNDDTASRVLLSLEWLYDSRIEPRLLASVAKTAIALESLLIFSESEALSQTLSERAAFILSADPIERQIVSRVFKRFYDVRSGVVHGNQKKARKLTPSLLETVDRLTVLLYLIVAANSSLWPTTDTIREWCETQRWGTPSTELKLPFSRLYLGKALAVGKQELDR